MPTRTLYTPTALEVLTAANLNKLAGGWLGYAEVTADQTGIGTSVTDLTSLSVTVTVPASRRVRVTGKIIVGAASTPPAVVELYIRDGSSTTLNKSQIRIDAASQDSLMAAWVGTPAPGSNTYKLSALVTAGTFTSAAAATYPSFILVEDLGPSS